MKVVASPRSYNIIPTPLKNLSFTLEAWTHMDPIHPHCKMQVRWTHGRLLAKAAKVVLSVSYIF